MPGVPLGTLISPDAVIVAIPALNEARHIEACLSSILGSDPFMAEVEIVVADGGSRDDTVARVEAFSAKHPNVRCIPNPGKLQSAGINRVAEMASPDHAILVRCDAHATYPPGYVRDVVRSLAERPEAASLATVMDARGEGALSEAAAWIVDTPLGSGGSAHRGGKTSMWVDHAHHAGFRLDWFRKIGGYDEAFSHNEDAEYDHRLGLAGGKVWLDADIRIAYMMRESLRSLWLQYWRYGRGRARTICKHRMRPRLRQMVPVAAALGILLGLLLMPFLPIAGLLPLLYLGLMLGASLAGAWALGSWGGLWSGVAMAAMHLGWGLGFLWQMLTRLRARIGPGGAKGLQQQSVRDAIN